MFTHIQAFHRPGSIREAVRLLEHGRGRTRYIAGGTDLAAHPDQNTRVLVDVTRLGLSYINQKKSSWVIGAATTIAEIERSHPLLHLADGILVKAAATWGPPQIRNMATLGGNLASGSPAASAATLLMALDAKAVVVDARRRYRIPVGSLFTGPRKTVLNGHLLAEIAIPAPPRGGRVGWSFQKLARTQGDTAIVDVAIGLQIDRRGCCKWARIALGAVAPTPLRAENAEKLLIGRKLDDALIEEVSQEVAREVDPITDVRATAEYRREMSRVLTARALRECAEHAGCTWVAPALAGAGRAKALDPQAKACATPRTTL